MSSFMPQLTILTTPVPSSALRNAKKLFHFFKRIVQGKLFVQPHGFAGHSAVTRSAVEGLQKIGAEFNYNPTSIEKVYDTVIVLADGIALRQAIEWKKKGRIRKLLAGPNLVVLPSDDPAVITAPEIDVYLVNSEWTYKAYIDDAPELKRNCAIWTAGVDTDFWIPSDTPKSTSRILFYQKNGPQSLVDQCRAAVQKQGFTTTTLSYGSYDRETYLRELQQSAASVFFSSSESQGIALAEAWSANVPTLVWNVGEVEYKGRKLQATSAPYLSASTGLFFSSPEEFETVFLRWKRERNTFAPRRWALEHMSDQVSARMLCTLAGKR